MKKRFLSWLLVLTMVISLIPSTLVTTALAALAAGSGVDITDAQALTLNADSDTAITADGTYTVSGSSTHSIVIGADAAGGTEATKVNVTLVLNDLKINSATSPIQILGGSELTLVLADGTENVLNCTKTGNAGEFDTSAGAGILCELGASLTIDKAQGAAGTGSLTVTGGYGGAGIGSGRFTSLYTNERAAKGGNSTRNYNLGSQVNWQGGDGGEGGRHGANAGTAGSVTINAGVLNITGGNGAAGIGGGMGAAGEAGAKGNNANSVVRFDGGGAAGSWFGTGGGGGGAGGNGGRGGSGGDVTINGGAVTVTGGRFTLNRSGKTVDVIPASIGGGAGGIGGNGGAGGAPANSTVNQPGDRWGTKGGIGETGYMNYNGDGGNLIVNGGTLRAVGNIRVGEDANKKGIQCAWADRNQGYLRGGTHCGYAAGLGAESTAPTLDSAQKALNIQIKGSENNVRFLDYDNTTKLSAQPTDKNRKTLYEVTLTVRNKADDTVVSSANVEVAVNRTDAAAKYTYKTVSDLDGKATLWLPKGEYSLSYFDVNRSDVGIIQQGDGKTFTVEENNDNAEEVKIGLNVTASASISNTQKVYINNTTTEADTPISIKIDATGADNSSLGEIKWFREKVNGNTKTYALNQTVNEYAFDASGYNDVTDPKDKGELTVAAGAKEAELKVLENGRYWLKIPMTVTDPNDPSKSMTVNLIRLVEVKNIYRSFPIQVRSQELDRDDGIRQTGKYGPLKTAIGLDYTAKYGFAWDLNGYHATNVAQGTLLANPPLGYDKVSVYALDSKAKWYTAHISTMDYERKDDRTGFKDPVSLTLDQSFLTNTYSDQVDGTQKHDISKYTITYKPDGVPVAEFPIRGILQDADGSEQKQLWQIVGTYPEGVTEATIDPIPQPGYRVVSVLVDGKKKDLDADNSIHLTNLQGTQDNHYNDAIKKVEFVYVSNMVEVTVNCVYNGKTHSSTISLEKGIAATVTAPTIDGYTATETTKTITPSDTDKTVTFTYTQNVGNITVIAVEKTADGGETELYRKDGGRVDRDNKIDLDGSAAAPVVKYFTKTADAPEVKVNNVVVDNPTTYTYDGSGDVTVTYTYTRDKHSLTVKKVDIDTQTEIPGPVQTIPDLPAGQQYTFGDTVTTPDGYAPVGGVNPTAYLIGEANGEVTFHYRKAGDHRYAEVTVECFYTENGQDTVFHSYKFPAFKDLETTITAPNLLGYKLKNPTKNSKTITPKGTADDKVRFEYELDAPRKITVKLVDHENRELTAPGYTTEYTIKNGDSVQISAPPINGYTLTSQDSVVTVAYNTVLPSGDNTVTFEYQPVSQANFVTHTVKFMLNNVGIYEYEKLILKAADTTKYTETSVTMTIPGYKLNDIELKVGDVSTTNTTAVDAPNDKDATIIYHFAEDAAEIVIVQKCVTANSGHDDVKTILKGYREGQTGIKVLAPPREGHALKNPAEWQKEVPKLHAGENTVVFEYIGIGDISFELVERDTQLNKDVVIQRVNGELNQEYNPELTGNLLNLTDMGYQFFPCAEADAPFNVGGNHSVKLTTPSGKVTYKVYYQKNARPVHFYAIDSEKYPKPTDMSTFTLDAVQAANAIIKNEVLTEKARVAETYKASALSIDFYKLDDDLSKYYYVEKTDNPDKEVNVYFWYRAKGSEDVTVNYQAEGQTILSYTVTATKGEKLALKAPAYLEGGKYKRADSQAENTTVDVTSTKIVELKYEPNFVNVTVETVTDSGTPSNYDHRQVNKTDGQGGNTNNLTLTPPYKGGYTLVGIAVQTDGTTTGGADEIPGIYNKNTGELNLTNLDKDTVVTYYYKTTTASEYQVPLTIRYLYNGYALKAEKLNFLVNKGEENTIEVPAFDGYTASTYTFQNGSGNVQTDQPIPKDGLKITPTAQTDLVLTITYTRTDGSVVLPGVDGKIDSPAHDKDNVIVKPDDPNKTPTLNPDPAPNTAPIKGSVTIPTDTTATVTRPTDPAQPDKGKEDITVPGGTTIDPDGTIHLPDGGPVIGPGDKIPDALDNSNFIAITYDSNNGSGEVKKVIREKGKLTVAGKLFEHPNGYKFEGWYGNGNGTGNVYATGQEVKTSITLYAKWSAKYKYSATITYKPNGGTPDADKPYIVGHDTDQKLYATLQSNFYQVSGWDFGGWNEQADGSGELRQPNDTWELSDTDAKTLYAQWYKVTNGGSSITVPGKDGDPNNESTNVTASGSKTQKPTRDDRTGVITIPDNGTITVTNPDGKKETILLPNGGTLKPDGSYTINQPDGGKIEVDKDGNESSKDDNGDPKPKDTIVTMTYHINNGTDGVVKVKAIEGKEVAIAVNTFVWSGYTFLNWMGTDQMEYKPGDPFTAANMEFWARWYKENNNGGGTGNGSIELPGKDNTIEAPKDKDNVIVTPDPNGTLTGPNQPDGSVKVETGGATVTRPIDPDKPEDGKEDIKVPAGTVVKPDGTIELPNGGGTIQPGDKLPDDIFSQTYVVVTYEPGNGGVGNVIREMVEVNVETWTLSGTKFTAPYGKEFDVWRNTDTNQDVGENTLITPKNNMTFQAQWKNKTPTVVTYTAEVVFDPNTDDGTQTQTFTGTNKRITGTLRGYDEMFTAPADWTFMGWSTAQAASSASSFYGDGTDVTLNDQAQLKLYAILYKKDETAGSIELPGKDGRTDGTDNVTVTKPTDGELKPGNGFITADTGSEIQQPDGTKVTVTAGPVHVYPDGSVYVPEGSKVTDKDGGDISGPTVVKPDGSKDDDANKKPIQRPDGTIVLPGQDGTIGTGGDDITVKPNGGNPTGTIDPDTGNVTITDPDGADVTFENKNPADVRVPVGTVITPDGQVTLRYTIQYTHNGSEIADPDYVDVELGGTKVVKSKTVNLYTCDERIREITGTLSKDLDDYVITFTYAKNGGSVEKPDGSIKVPGKDNRLDTEDDLIVKPDGSGNPTGKIDPDTGDVTITNPGGADVSVPGANPPATREDIKVPEGTVIKPDGTIILPDGKDGETPGGTIPGGSTVDPDGTIRYKYTIRYVDRQNGSELRQSTFKMVAKGDTVTIDAKPINGYSVDKESVTVTGGDGNYTITFTYDKLATGGNTGGGSSGGGSTGGGGGSSGGGSTGGGGSSKPTTKPGSSGGSGSIQIQVNDPKLTGVANLLETTRHIKFLNGFADGTFGPGKNMTRAQAAQMFFNLLKEKNVPITVNFVDVPEDAWYAQAVNTLASLGIINGKAAGNFDPNAPITRAQFVAIISRFAKASGDSVNFTDVTSDAWYYNYLCTAVNYGWINGKADGSFAPNANITRAEVATIVNRMLNRNGDASAILGGAVKQFSDVPSTFWAYIAIMEAANGHDHSVENGVETWGDLFQ